MIINISPGTKFLMIHRAALYSCEKISVCIQALFAFIKEEGLAWKSFLLNNYFTSTLSTLGSKTTASIAEKLFRSPQSKSLINLSHTSLEALKLTNRSWIQGHSLFRKKYPDFRVSKEALLDVIFRNDTDSQGVIKFAKRFLAQIGENEVSKSFISWEIARKKYEEISAKQKDPQALAKISQELFQIVQNFRGEKDHLTLLFEKEANSTDFPLSYYIKHALTQVKPRHDGVYQRVYSNVKKQLQAHLNTTWKKKAFTEIQEEIRVILFSEYSSLHKESTLVHQLSSSLEQLFSDNNRKPDSVKESLPGLIWDLLLQNGIQDSPDQPISKEKLHQIFEKEFEWINSEVENLARFKINQWVDKAGKDLQPLLQIWHKQLPHKDRGWLEIAYQSDTHYWINLYARDRENAASNIRAIGEPTPIKQYSYKVPKNLLEKNAFLELISPREGGDAPLSSSQNIKLFLSRFGRPSESYISSNDKVESQSLLDQFKIFHLENSESTVDSIEKVFFEMQLHAFINYSRSVENKTNISEETLSHIENGISIILDGANKLHDAGQLSDEEYIEIIATGLEIEECVLEKHYSLRKEVESSEILVPSILKEQVRKIFSSSGFSKLDVEAIESFAKVLLGNDMSEEIALLCKELPITFDKLPSFFLSHISLKKSLERLYLDIKNLRASPIAIFKLYFNIHSLLKNIRSLIGWLTYLPYIYLIVSCCINPITAGVCLLSIAISLYFLFHVLELEPILPILAAGMSFQKEVFSFLVTRLILRTLQLTDKVLQWNKIHAMEAGRSFLTNNISNKVSFSLKDPLNLDQHIIPEELKPLQKFYPHMEIWADTDNAKEVSAISFPNLSMEFSIQEQNGEKRAYLQGQPGFWLADLITDRRLETLDFAHLVLENEQGDRKICVIPRSERRLLLQTLLKMVNSYSRKSVDILSTYIQNKKLKIPEVVYYYDVVDRELVSQDFNAISYLITHYMTSGDTTRTEMLVDQLSRMKANGNLENPNSIVKTLEQISLIIPNSMNSRIAKIILELSTLCEEIPVESKAFALFLRAYQYYVESKHQSGKSYLSENQEKLLANHLKDRNIQQQILNGVGKLVLATQSPLVQAPMLLLNNLIDIYFPQFSKKENYVPTSLKNYELERKYLKEENTIISLFLGLILNNLVNPVFSINKDMVDMGKIIKDGQRNIFEQLPIIISKLNTEKSTLKLDYFLILTLLQFQRCKDPVTIESIKKWIPLLNGTYGLTPEILEELKKVIPLLNGMYALTRDNLSAFLTEPTNAFKIEEKFAGLIQHFFSFILSENVNTYGQEKVILDFYLRHVLQSGLTTVHNYREIHNKSKKEQRLRTHYSSVFPQLQLGGKEYRTLHALEQSIVDAYQQINKAFLQKQVGPIHTRSELTLRPGSSIENQMVAIANWYESGKDREQNLSYTLQNGRKEKDLIKRLDKVYKTLQEKLFEQQKTLEALLMQPLPNLPSLEGRIKEYTQDIRNNATMINQTQEEISKISSHQSIIKKVGTMAIGYINSLLEIPTLGKINILRIGKIEQLVEKKKNLVNESESIKFKRQQLFNNIITAFKTETALGLSEVYDYFCQGKDALIIQSLGLDNDQWKVLKEQLYQYMVLQKHLSIAQNIHKLCRNESDEDIRANLNHIGHELDSMFNSIHSGEELELSLRSRLHFEKKLGKSLSPPIRDKWVQAVNSSLENFQSIYKFCTS